MLNVVPIQTNPGLETSNLSRVLVGEAGAQILKTGDTRH